MATAAGALLPVVPGASATPIVVPAGALSSRQIVSVSGDGRYVVTYTGFDTGSDAALTDRLTGTTVDIGAGLQLSDDGSTLLRPDLGWTDLRTGRTLPPPVTGRIVTSDASSISTGRFFRVPPKLMSNDGRFVVFSTLEPTQQAWRWDTATGRIDLVLDDAAAVTISGSGRYVVARRLVPCAFFSAGCPAIFVVDMTTGVQQPIDAVMWAVSAISDDGRRVVGVLGPLTDDLTFPWDAGLLDRTTNMVQRLGRWRGDIQMSNDGTVVTNTVGHTPAVMLLPDTTLHEVGPDIGDNGAFLTGDGSAILYLSYRGFNDDHTSLLYEIVSIPVRGGAPRVGADESVPLTIAGRFGVPGDAVAVALNVTAVGMTGSGFVTVYPCGGTVPLASNLNHEAGQTVPNAVVAKLDDQGRVCLYTKSGGDLVVDVVGYFPAGTPLDAITPVRLLDTRQAIGGSTTSPVAGGSVVRVQVAGTAGVDAGATTAVLNLTATGAATDGFVTVFPCSGAAPTVSNLNYSSGQTVANAVVARLDAAGGTCLFTKSSTHLVVDVNGTAAGAGALAGIEPLRLLDTRDGGTPVAGGEAVRVRVAGRGAVPADASAAVLNVTATEPVADGFLTVYPCSTTPPTASTVNYLAGQTVANLALARLSADGDVCIFTKAATHVVVDVGGAATGSSGFVAIDPVRALDTRSLP